MHYSNIKYVDIANGPGIRTTLFVSGCRRYCEQCFNPETWDFNHGDEFTGEVADKVLDSLAPSHVDGLTLLGGEPFEPGNQPSVLDLVCRVRERYGSSKTIWAFSGFTFEELTGIEQPHICSPCNPMTDSTDAILDFIDVLVDGPFVNRLKDLSLRFRGSSNQRILDVPASLAAGHAVLWEDDEIFCHGR